MHDKQAYAKGIYKKIIQQLALQMCLSEGGAHHNHRGASKAGLLSCVSLVFGCLLCAW